jgi:hypothetical protein
MTRLARKTCPQCGHECLEPEIRCWACGEFFAPRTLVPSPARQAPTLVGYPAPQRARRRRGLPWVAVALLTLVLGVGLHLTAFWYQSEARSPDAVALQPLPVTEDSRLRPAPPPLGADPANSGVSVTPPFSAPTRQSRTNRRVFSGPPPDGTPPPSGPPRVAAPPSGRPRAVPPPARFAPPALPVPRPAPPPMALAVPSARGEALIAIHNDTPTALDFDFGADNFSGTVAPHSVVTVPLSGGEYDLALRSLARKDTLYDIRIEGGRHYEVAFTGRNTRLVSE